MYIVYYVTMWMIFGLWDFIVLSMSTVARISSVHIMQQSVIEDHVTAYEFFF